MTYLLGFGLICVGALIGFMLAAMLVAGKIADMEATIIGLRDALKEDK